MLLKVRSWLSLSGFNVFRGWANGRSGQVSPINPLPLTLIKWLFPLPSQDCCLKGPSQAFLGIKILSRERQKKSIPALSLPSQVRCEFPQWRLNEQSHNPHTGAVGDGGGGRHVRDTTPPPPRCLTPPPTALLPNHFARQIAKHSNNSFSPRMRIQGGLIFQVKQRKLLYVQNTLSLFWFSNPSTIWYIFTTRLIKRIIVLLLQNNYKI